MMPQAQAHVGVAESTATGSLIDEILAETRISAQDEAYAIARRGVEALVSELLTSAREGERVDRVLCDAMIAEIDERIGRQLDEILHHAEFQRLESAWRGLKFVVDRTSFRENIELQVLHCGKEELAADFDDAPEDVQSALYKLVYTAEYGTYGGTPFGAIIANYDFGPSAPDLALLRHCAAVAAMAHAPFIAAAGPQFFGLDAYERLPQLKDLRSLLDGPQFERWQSFRETEDARQVALTLPRFLLRLPYGKDSAPVRGFQYEESTAAGAESYLWGNAAFAFATRVTDSFARYRWCPHIIGPQSGGTVENLPLHQFAAMGALQTKIPTEILISERREYELSEEGFIALTMRKDSDNACFFSANSCQKAKQFGQSAEGQAAETSYRLGTQLPYLFIVNRLAHYIKVLQREQIGSAKTAADLERELASWVSQYVVDMDNPTAAVRAQRPLRQAEIRVEEVPGEAGFYKVDLKVRPHFKYMGAFFTLSLVGRLEKE